MENFSLELKKYIAENYVEEIPCAEDAEEDFESEDNEKPSFLGRVAACFGIGTPSMARRKYAEEFSVGSSVPNFNMILQENKGETFSQMLIRLIKASGEKNSSIYNRANVDRRLFSKIINTADYKPARNTALAFAVALKLSYAMTQELLATAGFTLNKKNLGDVIINFFIDKKIFDIETINESLYEYKQPLIGGGQKFCRSADDLSENESDYNSDTKIEEVIKMANNTTEVVFILDRSGSMGGLEKDTIGGFNSMLKKHKNGDTSAFVSTVLFSTESKVIHDRLPIAEIPELTENEYSVGGGTALLDAMGDAIKHIKNIHKYARPEDVPAKTIFIITTDGEENSSQRYSYNDIKKLVEGQKEKGWDFVFMGANIDAFDIASHLGISAKRTVNYHNDSQGTKARFASMANFFGAAMAAKSMEDVTDEWRDAVDTDFKSRK